ncbi:MAG TPA: hypothetical protein OIM45_03435 [Clostridiaceae bacterium]|nr:hypothetical protein [Clostridiaceae bacterium]
MCEFNYEEWNDKYHNRKFINLIDYLNDNDMNILNKLGISVEDKEYTEYELDIIKQELNQYDDRFEIEEYDEKVKEDIRKIKKSLKEKNISNEMFYKLEDKL